MRARERRPQPPAGKLLSWAVTAVLIGWFVVYNLFRIGGDSPHAAAWISLGIGAACGLAVLAFIYAFMSRSPQGFGRRGAVFEIPAPGELDEGQRAAVRIAVPLLGALAVVALVMGVVLGVDWIRTATSLRSHTTLLILTLWNLFIGGWLALEFPRLRREDVEGIDSIALGCVLTTVLAGVGLSRGDYEAGQELLILISGLAGMATQLAVWRFTHSRWSLVYAMGIGVIAALALALPLAL